MHVKAFRVLLVLILIVVLCALAAFIAGVITFHPLFTFNVQDVPPVTANPVEADKIFAISKFRSDSGHDYSFGAWDGETCRSMKHYFNFGQKSENNMPVRSYPTPGHPNIQIYAPFNGIISAINNEQTPIGKQIFITSAENSSFYVRLFHIDLLPSLHIGSNVTSGQQIGTIGPMDGMDVSYEAHYLFGQTVYLSIFQYMTPQAFAPFAKLGYTPPDFILTKQQADAMNYQCNGQMFVHSADFFNNPQNIMEGYVSLRPNPYQYLYNQQNQNMQNNTSQ